MISGIDFEGVEVGGYLLERVIGKEPLGKVWRAYSSQACEVFSVRQFCKHSMSSEPMKSTFRAEVSSMSESQHQNLSRVYDFFETDKNFFLVSDYCREESLASLAKKSIFSEEKAVFFLKQLANGVLELRKQSSTPREVKADSVFLKDQERIIIDRLKMLKSEGDTAGAGDLRGAPEGRGPKTDLWSLGVVFHLMILGELPFEGSSAQEVASSIDKVQKAGLSLNGSISKLARSLLEGLLRKDPAQRFSWADFFSHQIFEKTIDSPFAAGVESEFSVARKLAAKGTLGEKSDPKAAPPRKPQVVSEEEISPEVKKKFIDGLLAKEVFFRYSHEKNKMLLLERLGQAASNLAQEAYLDQARAHLLSIGAKSVEKSANLSRKLKSDLEEKKNSFGLAPQAFKAFLSTSWLANAQKLLAENQDSLASQLKKLQEEMKGLDAKPIPEEISASASKLSPKDFIGEESIGFAFYQLLYCANLSEKIDTEFPYFQPGPRRRKFDWNRFYFQLTKLSIAELASGIKH